jgi:hypothetical protein
MSRSLLYQQGHRGENMVLRPRTVGAIDMGGASLQVCASSRVRDTMEAINSSEASL